MRILLANGNEIVASPEFAEQHYPGAWTALPDEPMPAPVPPAECSPSQGLVALYALRGISETDVQTAIAGIPDPVTRYTASVAFNRATAWQRHSPTMQQLAGMLGLSEVDLDELFAYAAEVQV